MSKDKEIQKLVLQHAIERKTIRKLAKEIDRVDAGNVALDEERMKQEEAIVNICRRLDALEKRK